MLKILVTVLTALTSLTAVGSPTDGTPRTQPIDGDGMRTSGSRVGAQATQGLHTDEPIVIDHRIEVENAIRENGEAPIAINRQPEVEDLRLALVNSERHTVVLLSDSLGGGRIVYEEFIRQHPNDTYLRLNFERLRHLDENQAYEELRKLLTVELREKAKATSGRVYLFIENLAALQQGLIRQPLHMLFEQLVFGVEYHVVIDSDVRTFKAVMDPNKGKYAVLDTLIETVTVKPPKFNQVLSEVYRRRTQIETNRVGFSALAAEEAAYIGSRHYPLNPLKGAMDLLRGAMQLVENDIRAGSSLRDRLSSEIRLINRQLDALKKDLETESDSGVKARVQQRIQALNEQLVGKTKDLSSVSAETGIHSQLAKTNRRLGELKLQYDEVKKSSTLSPAQMRERLSSIEAESKILGAQQAEFEQELLKSEANGEPAKRVGVRQILAVASKWLNKSPEQLASQFDSGIRKIDDIKRFIYGQDHAIDTIARYMTVDRWQMYEGAELGLSPDQVADFKAGRIESPRYNYTVKDLDDIRSGLKNVRERPRSVLWFGGPSGVGKSETTKLLSRFVNNDEAFMIPMNQYLEKHRVSELIGPPPGYVGHGTPGSLNKHVKENPNAIILFDEVEKAHPDILNALLTIMNEGRLSDSTLGWVDFRNTQIIMTSNLAQEVSRYNIGECIEFLKNQTHESGWTDAKIAPLRSDRRALQAEVYRIKAVQSGMRPEFFGRVDAIVLFDYLSPENALKVARKASRSLVASLDLYHGIKLKFTDSAVAGLLNYFTESEGGRSMNKVFFNFFRAPLAMMMEAGSLKPGDVVIASAGDGAALDFTITTPDGLAAAEKATTGSSATLDSLKDRLLADRGKNQQERAARAGNAELARKVFKPEEFVSERVFRFLKRR